MAEPYAAQRFPIPGSGSVRLALLSNLPLDVQQTKVRRAIISIHGVGSKAHLYYVRALQSLRGHTGSRTRSGHAVTDVLGDTGDTLVIAPQFMYDDDIIPSPPDPGVLYWYSPPWGAGAVNGGNPSSFKVLDELLRHLCNRDRYRALSRIVLVGHSSGGQFLHRYAISGVGEDLYARPLNIHVRYIAMNPGSYLYLTPERPAADEVTFAPPTVGAVGTCVGFDNWGYGFGGALAPYVLEAGYGQAAMEDRYRKRDVVYLVGDEDIENQTNCAEVLQRPNRLRRSRAYFNYLVHHFGEGILTSQQHAIVPDVGHSGGEMLRSPITRRFLFEDFGANPRLQRRGDSAQAGPGLSQVAAIDHWDDDGNNTDDQIMAAIRDDDNSLRLVSWRTLADGSIVKSSTSEPTKEPALALDITRVVRKETTGSGATTDQLAYVTSSVTSGSNFRLVCWDAYEQGLVEERFTANRTMTGNAINGRVISLTDDRILSVQIKPNNRLVFQCWRVEDNGTFQRLDTTGETPIAADTVELVRRRSTRAVAVSSSSGPLQVALVRVNNLSTTSEITVTGTTGFIDTPDEHGLVATMGPYGRLYVGYRHAATSIFRMTSFRVTNTGVHRLHDTANQVGKVSLGLSLSQVGPYGLCSAVRTESGKGKLIFWRVSPGGRMRRVADTGNTIGEIGRHHRLTVSKVSTDITLNCITATGDLKLIGYRYIS